MMREGVDRIVFAMIRLSGGRLGRLENTAIPLFRQDWRDLLVAADFAEDIHTHTKRGSHDALIRAWTTDGWQAIYPMGWSSALAMPWRSLRACNEVRQAR